MAKRTYHDELDRKNMEKLLNILSELPDYVGDYFISRRSNTTTRTRLSYAYDLRTFFRYLVDMHCFPSEPENLNDVSLSDLGSLKARDIEQYMDYLQADAGYTKRTVARTFACLSSFLFFLYRNDLVPENVCNKVLNVKPDHDMRIVRLQPDEVVKFLDAIEFGCSTFTPRQAKYLEGTRDRDLAISALILGTGIRVSEVVALNLENLYLDKAYITIRGKGGKIRTIPVGDEAIEALERYLKKRKTIVPADEASERALFLSTQRKRMSVQTVEDMISKYAEAIGVQDRITPHALRRTFGTNLYNESGGDLFLTARFLGHNNVNTTRQHYVATDEESLFEARNKVVMRKEKTETNEDS